MLIYKVYMQAGIRSVVKSSQVDCRTLMSCCSQRGLGAGRGDLRRDITQKPFLSSAPRCRAVIAFLALGIVSIRVTVVPSVLTVANFIYWFDNYLLFREAFLGHSFRWIYLEWDFCAHSCFLAFNFWKNYFNVSTNCK